MRFLELLDHLDSEERKVLSNELERREEAHKQRVKEAIDELGGLASKYMDRYKYYGYDAALKELREKLGLSDD